MLLEMPLMRELSDKLFAAADLYCTNACTDTAKDAAPRSVCQGHTCRACTHTDTQTHRHRHRHRHTHTRTRTHTYIDMVGALPVVSPSGRPPLFVGKLNFNFFKIYSDASLTPWLSRALLTLLKACTLPEMTSKGGKVHEHTTALSCDRCQSTLPSSTINEHCQGVSHLCGQLINELAQASLCVCLGLACEVVCSQVHSCTRLYIIVDLQWGQCHLQQQNNNQAKGTQKVG